MHIRPRIPQSAALGLALAIGTLALSTGCASTEEITSDSVQPAQDTWITTKVMGELAAVNGLENTDIGVETSNGVVTLTGRVESQAMADAAVAAAQRVDGVVDVDTAHLQVAPGG
jgi:hyperosmotically inducible protein